MNSTVVYIYALTNDSGFAPCIDNKWLTLTCCKGGIRGGMRKSAAKEYLAGNNVYLLGLCSATLAKNREMLFSPVYFAKIDEVIEMTEYYADDGLASGRNDDVYKLENGVLKPKAGNPHSEYNQSKDIGGQYALCSHQFTYWGDKCGETGMDIENKFGEIFAGIRNRRGFRGYMVRREFAEFSEAIQGWDWFPKKPGKCNIISNRAISGDPIVVGRRCGQ